MKRQLWVTTLAICALCLLLSACQGNREAAPSAQPEETQADVSLRLREETSRDAQSIREREEDISDGDESEAEAEPWEEQRAMLTHESPTNTALAYLSAMRRGDTATAIRCLIDRGAEQQASQEADAEDNELQDLLDDILSSMEYTILEEEIDEDTATVLVSFRVYDGAQALEWQLTTEFRQNLAQSLGDNPIVEFTEDQLHFDLRDVDRLETQATLYLIRDDAGLWYIDNHNLDNLAFDNAITGNFYTGLLEFQQRMAEMRQGVNP